MIALMSAEPGTARDKVSHLRYNLPGEKPNLGTHFVFGFNILAHAATTVE